MGKRIVILGGGIGGVVAANRLREALTQDNDIVVVDREKNHLGYGTGKRFFLKSGGCGDGFR